MAAASSSSPPVDVVGDVVSQMKSLVVFVNATVAKRLAEWSAAFYSDQRASAAVMAQKVDLVVDSFVTACSPDFSDDVDFVQVPAHHAKLLDRLRREQPRVFELLVSHADKLFACDPLKAKDVVKAAIEEVMAAA